jgi:hypothetical protein
LGEIGDVDHRRQPSGATSDVLREVQETRKKNALDIADRIVLTLEVRHDELCAAL